MGTIIFISGQEIFVIMIVVLLLFGADKIPEIFFNCPDDVTASPARMSEIARIFIAGPEYKNAMAGPRPAPRL